ncbi:hypothetical protein TNCV_4807201 [Trichonephila clavipes]|nr:hypothetical protein TNCV_4807201 [Trichonephila clavipes]
MGTGDCTDHVTMASHDHIANTASSSILLHMGVLDIWSAFHPFTAKSFGLDTPALYDEFSEASGLENFNTCSRPLPAANRGYRNQSDEQPRK